LIKKINLIFLVFCFTSLVSSQEISFPKFVLSNVEFQISPLSGNDSTIYNVEFFDTGNSLSYEINGGAESKIKIPNSGLYQIKVNGEVTGSRLRVIPGWLSILPPLLAIFLALLIRQVLVSLFAGIYLGAIFIYDYNPLSAILRLSDTIMIETLIDKDHMFIIVFTLLFGGVIGVIARNGGTVGLSNLVTRFAKTARTGLISSWLMGLIIFFDDYANTLIIGNMMRPITDKLKISREKLAYIVDSTAAPMASVFIISSWIGFEIGLIDAGLKAIGSEKNAYELLLQTIPYRFYPLAALFFVFLTSYLRRDFGAMFKAEYRARTTGELFENTASAGETGENQIEYRTENAKWINGALPIGIILLGTIVGLILSGIGALQEQNITDYSIRNIINNSDSFSSLLWASFGACLVAIIMSVSQKLLKLSESVGAWTRGVQSMLFACIILVFAWAISKVTVDLHTADYLISILSGVINPRLFPLIVFIICALISFSTGTSWGTMGIIMPLVIPLSYKLCHSTGFNHEDTTLIIYGTISSVLAGSVFGDHCSPIADTTILSSMASRCNHIDHVKTQLPYAVLVGMVCMLLGDLPTAYGMSPYISLILIFGILTGLLLLFGKKLPVVRVD
jgi:Na+/H+ antiporter NhaC